MEKELIVVNQDLLNLNKKGLEELGKQQADEVMEAGYHDAVALLVASKKLSTYVDAFNKALKSKALDELTAQTGGLTAHNAKVEIMNTGNKLDYMEDSVYANLKAQLDARAALLKLAQKQKIADVETGEEIPKVGIKTFGALTPKVTL